MEPDFVSWRGHRVHVKVTGQGDPLLLITGLGGSTDQWAPFAQQFPNRRVIRFDVPGTGESSAPLSPMPVPPCRARRRGPRRVCSVEFTDVIGFSYGGAVAQQLAFDYPERVRRLVLAATNCGLGAVPGSFGAMASLATPLRYYSPTYFDRTAAHSYGGMTGRDLSVRRRMMAERHRHPPSAYGYAMQLLGHGRLVEPAVPVAHPARHARDRRRRRSADPGRERGTAGAPHPARAAGNRPPQRPPVPLGRGQAHVGAHRSLPRQPRRRGALRQTRTRARTGARGRTRSRTRSWPERPDRRQRSRSRRRGR